MTIPVTTRSGKGSPLTDSEVDTNWTNLARNATQTQQGNIEVADDTEAAALTDTTLAIAPGSFPAAFDAQVATLSTNLTTNGYSTLPGGLIIQWGTMTVPDNSSATINFPLTFPTAVFAVTTTADSTFMLSSADGADIYVNNLTVSSFDIYTGVDQDRVGTVAYFMAIGH